MGRIEEQSLAQHAARVLLVEDIILNQVVLQAQLEESGYKVTLAMNGADALEKLRDAQFDLVLMDLQMPVMGGIEAATRIRDDLGIDNATMPIIAITSYPEHTVIKDCLEAGMDDCLTKPVRSCDLDETIREWLGQADYDPSFHAPDRHQKRHPPEDTRSLLDENQIQETILYIGNDSLRDMYTNFIKEADIHLDTLKKGRALSIAELHHLGTSSSYMGLWRIKRLCDNMITYMDAEKDKDFHADIMDELKDEFKGGIAELDKFMFKSGIL